MKPLPYRAFAAFALIAAAATIAGCSRKTPDPVKAAPPVVTVTFPVARLITDYEDFTGRTEPVRMVELKARVTGHLDHVYFRDGQDTREALFPIIGEWKRRS